MSNALTRAEFLKAGGVLAATAALGESFGVEADIGSEPDYVFLQREIDAVTPDDFADYLKGGSNGFCGLFKPPVFSRLDEAFDCVAKAVRECEVVDKPAVWFLYNMGIVVKTRESVFSVDLMHRKATELAPILDFALITHNHRDHYTEEFYRAMNDAGKTVVSNFKDNYGAADWRKGGKYWEAGGYTRAEKTFKLKDVEIRTALTDHNPYLVDFTTTFEIRVGKWRLFHTGDCGNAAKLSTVWGKPDLWLVFPGCGIDIAAAYRKIKPKRMVFGHLWELGHETGRLTTPMVKAARAKVEALGGKVDVPLWGERVV